MRQPVLNLGFALVLGMGVMATGLVVVDGVWPEGDPPSGRSGGRDEASAEQAPHGREARPGVTAGDGLVLGPAVAAAGRQLQSGAAGQPSAADHEIPGESAAPAAPPAERLPSQVALDEMPGAKRLILLGLGLSSAPDRLVVEVEASAPLLDFRQMRVEDPPRWVFDLPGDWAPQPSQEIVAAHPLVDTVRVGRHPDKLRLVVDLGKTLSAVPEIRSTPRGLTIELRRR